MDNNIKNQLDRKYAGQIVRAIKKDDVEKVKELLDNHLDYLAYDNKSKGTYIYSSRKGFYKMYEISFKYW